ALLVREYPELHDAIAKGEIHLTGVLMLGPHLGGERHAELLRRARFRSKRELLRLIAEIDPKPEVPALIEPIGPAPAGRATHTAFMQALAGPVRELPSGSRPADWIAESAEPAMEGGIAQSLDSATEEPIAESVDSGAEEGIADGDGSGDSAAQARPLHYRVQFTASQEFVDLLEEAKALLGYETPRPTLPEIQVRALRALVQQLRTRKRGATKGRPPAAARVSDVAPVSAPARVSDIAPVSAPARLDVASVDAPARLDVASVDAPARRRSRHTPASVRRAVFERDGERCAY